MSLDYQRMSDQQLIMVALHAILDCLTSSYSGLRQELNNRTMSNPDDDTVDEQRDEERG